jgi:type III secretion protein S
MWRHRRWAPEAQRSLLVQSPELVDMLQRAMVLLTVTAAPAVIVSAVVGLVLAIVQAATQLQDQSIAQALKLGAVLLVLVITGSWMGGEVVRFGDQVLTHLPRLGR